jgi:hypothetical protein
VKLIKLEDRVKARPAKKVAGPSRRDKIRYRGVKDKPYRDPNSCYIHLQCGHLTTMEEIELYRAWQPKGKYLCTVCNNWVKQEIPKPTVIPDIPLF